MGYYTDYSLRAYTSIDQIEDEDANIFDDENFHDIEAQMTKDLCKIHFGEEFDEDAIVPERMDLLISFDAMKWYEYDEDMMALSAKYPDYYFVLYGNGEESDDIWKTLYHKGKEIDTSVAYIHYPEFRIPEDIDE